MRIRTSGTGSNEARKRVKFTLFTACSQSSVTYNSGFVNMFCSSCGIEKLIENAKYCSNCGFKYSEQVNSKNSNKISFDEFRKRKEETRTHHFNRGMAAKKLKSNSTSTATMQDVTIQIGLMATKDGEMKVKRGSNLPLKVSPSTNYEELKDRAVAKHSVFNTDIPNRPTGFKMLYPDKRSAEKLPGSDQEFVLKLYKEKLGKPDVSIVSQFSSSLHLVPNRFSNYVNIDFVSSSFQTHFM